MSWKDIRKNYLHGQALREALMDRFEGKCVWCGKKVRADVELFKNNGDKVFKLPHDAATIDHLREGQKGSRPFDPEGNDKVLACHQCNQRRGKEFFIKYVKHLRKHETNTHQ